MSRFRLYPTPEQEVTLREHCAHARFVWNLAVEQQSWWRPGRGKAPNFAQQKRQLTEARAESDWLRAGSQTVQSYALIDFDRAMNDFYRGIHGKPTWRKVRLHESFRVEVAQTYKARRLSRKTGEVQVPKLGWVRFRWTRPVPDVKSYQVTQDRSGRWHVAFTAKPNPIPAPGNGEVVGVDRGVAVSAALSTGEMLHCPRPSRADVRRGRLLQHKLERAKPGSKRRERVRIRYARLRAQEVDRRKDWAEKASTDIARRFDVIRIEDLNIKAMTRSARGTLARPGRHIRQKAGLTREIRYQGWGLLGRRLEDKAPGRVEKVNPQFTSRRCSACGHVDAKSRKSQADFVCTACNFACNADVNAAINIAAGYAVTARRGSQLGPVKREPQAGDSLESAA